MHGRKTSHKQKTISWTNSFQNADTMTNSEETLKNQPMKKENKCNVWVTIFVLFGSGAEVVPSTFRTSYAIIRGFANVKNVFNNNIYIYKFLWYVQNLNNAF